MLKYLSLSDLLIQNFREMKIKYDEYAARTGFEYGAELAHCFYSCQFAPFIIKQLDEGNMPMLKKIFAFIEHLHVNGDEDVENVAWVSVCEPVYFRCDYDKHRSIIMMLSGEKTKECFIEMENFVP